MSFPSREHTHPWITALWFAIHDSIGQLSLCAMCGGVLVLAASAVGLVSDVWLSALIVIVLGLISLAMYIRNVLIALPSQLPRIR